jgi:hypothetical protein
MAITASTRLCTSCRAILPDAGAPVCAHCGKVAIPLVADWPQAMRRYLTLLTVADASSPFTNHTDQQRWQWLLLSRFRLRQYGSLIVPLAASADDCYPVAIRALEAWENAGRPSDFDAVIRTRDTLRIRDTANIDAPTALVGVGA